MEASGAAIKSYHESGYSGEPFADSESTEKTANRFLGIFSVLAALVAISHRVLRETVNLKSFIKYCTLNLHF